MTMLISKLNKRVEIQQLVQSGNSNASLKKTYVTIRTCWAGIEEDRNAKYLQALAGVSVDDAKDVYKFIFRTASLYPLMRAMSSGFDSGFKTGQDLVVMKNGLFILMQEPKTGIGKRFKVTGTKIDENSSEKVIARCQYVEEIGTGANG